MSEKQESIEEILRKYGYTAKATPNGWRLEPKADKGDDSEKAISSK